MVLRSHDTIGQNHGPVWKTQLFLLTGICSVILWQNRYLKRQFEKILLKYGWEKGFQMGMFFVHREKGSFLSVDVGDITTDGKRQNIVQMLEVPNTEVDVREPTSFFDHVYCCTQGHANKCVDGYCEL